MDLIQKNYLQYAIQDVLDLLERANTMRTLHRAQPEPNELAIEGYERQRQQFLEQLADLLAQFEVEVLLPHKAA
jgi:hypothetical protein